jgi:hypothetical protein
MPLWRIASGRPEELQLPGGQPLLAAPITLLGDAIQQNLRRGRFPAELYMEALTQLHRLLLFVPLTQRGLPHVSWPLLWGALFSLGTFVAQSDEFFAQPRVPHVAAKLLQLLNLLLVLGEQIFPSEAVFEAFAYELVRVHESFDRLLVVCKRVAPDLMGASSMTRSLVVQALQRLASMKDGEAGQLTSSGALSMVRKLQGQVSAPQKAALSRPPPPMTPHGRSSFAQSLLRVLLATARADGSVAPLHFEDLVAATR